MTIPPAIPAPDSDPYAHSEVADLIARALVEDLHDIGDLTCSTLVPAGARLDATIRAQAQGVICGLPLFPRIVAELGGRLDDLFLLPDGEAVQPGQVVFKGQGDATTLLIAERTALNFCQHLSGIASMTRRYVDAVSGTSAKVFDTRKTTPNLRLLEKHAVVMGGGRNHRMGLYDQVLIKENHICLMVVEDTKPGQSEISKPAEAVTRCRRRLGQEVIIEVEIEQLDDLEPVIAAGADIVLLDNMVRDQIAQAVVRRNAARRPDSRVVLLEASGGIILSTIRAVAHTGVERISVGALTHSVQALDLSMRCSVAPAPI